LPGYTTINVIAVHQEPLDLEETAMPSIITRPNWITSDFPRTNRLMDEVLTRFPWTDLLGTNGESTSTWIPPVDIFESNDELRLVAELPGVKPEDVKLSVNDSTLTIRGEKSQVAEQKSGTVHRYERSYGSFERSFQLPRTVDADRTRAAYEHGVLTISIPKAEQAKAREIKVDVKK
jgi:HSP20 family protein